MPKKQHKEEPAEEKDLQRKYLQLQVLKQQLSAMVEEKNAINERLAEITTTIQAVQKLSDVKRGEEIWSSLGSGAFVRSDIKDIDNIFVAAGAGVVIKETRERAVEILASRLAQIQKIDGEIVAEINKFSEEAARMERELQHAVENR